MANTSAQDPEHLRIHRTISRAVHVSERGLALQQIAEGVTEIVGFGVAAISHVREDGLLEVVAVAGNDEARELLLGSTLELAAVQRELDVGDQWGLLRFVPEGRIDPDATIPGWVPDLPPSDDPDAWRPMDALFAPLIDEAGEMVGLLSVDVPADGKRPSRGTRRLLERYAIQAGRAVIETMARNEMAEEIRLSHAARSIVRSATAHLSLERILKNSQVALIEGFAAYATWLQTIDEHGLQREIYHTQGPLIRDIPSALRALSLPAARVLWKEQRAGVVSRTEMPSRLGTKGREQLLAFLEDSSLTSFMLVPVGAGHQCLGYFVLCRTEGAAEWTTLEKAVALDIGHDLGRALLNAKLFEREQQLVTELTEIDAYKSRLISTISHELRTPLTSIVGHAELLESSTELEPSTQQSLKSIVRNAQRLSRIVEELLLFSSVGNTAVDGHDVVDLSAAVIDALDVLHLQAEAKEIEIGFEAPVEKLVVAGEAADFDRVLTNLISNAIKYTKSGGTVHVTVERKADVVELCVVDNGIGISALDQKRLFVEFFRSSNPEALVTEGTGLGLAIVQRIVDGLGGKIEVESELGQGSTFRVTLPAAS